jgi:hypothetical protein
MASLETVKTGKNFILYKSGDQKLIKIENARFSYPYFGAKREEEDENGGEPRYTWGGVLMLPKTTHVEAKDAFMALINEIQAANEVKIPPEYRCIKNGDDKEDENMHGHWLISFSERYDPKKPRRPHTCRDKRAQLIEDEAKIDEMFYGGCWGHALLRPWYFNGQAKGKDKKFPKRIACGFTGVMFWKDDKPFGNGRIDDTTAWGAGSGDDDLDDDDL